MQNIINDIQSGDITGNKLIELLVKHEDKNVDDYNEIHDTLILRDKALTEQSAILEKQHLALLKQDGDKKIFEAN